MWAAARETVVRPVSIGWRSDSKAWRGNSGKLVQEQHAAMRQADLSGTRPVATAGQRGLRRGVVRFPEGRPHHQPAAVQHAGDAVDHADLQRRSRIQVRQQARQARGEHGLAGARRSDQQQVVAPGRGDLHRAPGGFHALHVGHVGTGPHLGHASGAGRRQHLGAAEMVDQAQQVGAAPGLRSGRPRLPRRPGWPGRSGRDHARRQRSPPAARRRRGSASHPATVRRARHNRRSPRAAGCPSRRAAPRRAADRNGCPPSAGRRV